MIRTFQRHTVAIMQQRKHQWLIKIQVTWNVINNLKEVIIIIINVMSQGDINGMRVTRAKASDRWGLRKLRCANATASVDSEGVCPDCSYTRHAEFSYAIKSWCLASQAKIYAKLMASWSVWLMHESGFERNKPACMYDLLIQNKLYWFYVNSHI